MQVFLKPDDRTDHLERDDERSERSIREAATNALDAPYLTVDTKPILSDELAKICIWPSPFTQGCNQIGKFL